MARVHQRLTALAVSRAKQPRLYADGGSLYLQVSQGDGRSWSFKIQRGDINNGRPRAMGLRPLSTYSLAEARELARTARQLVHQGRDPIEERTAARAAAVVETVKMITFKKCVSDYVAKNRDSWRSSDYASQWTRQLEIDIYPVLGNVPVAQIDVALVVQALEGIWKTKTDTAARLRQRVEAVFYYAISHGYRTGPNPAARRGCLDAILPKPLKLIRVEHFAALRYSQMGEFMTKRRTVDSSVARALEFTILTACRSNEVRFANWSEIDPEATWTIPSRRAKSGRECRVPLSPAQPARPKWSEVFNFSLSRENLLRDLSRFLYPVARAAGDRCGRSPHLVPLRAQDQGPRVAPEVGTTVKRCTEKTLYSASGWEAVGYRGGAHVNFSLTAIAFLLTLSAPVSACERAA